MKTWIWITIILVGIVAAVFGTMSYTNGQYEVVKGADGKPVQTGGHDTYTKK